MILNIFKQNLMGSFLPKAQSSLILTLSNFFAQNFE